MMESYFLFSDSFQRDFFNLEVNIFKAKLFFLGLVFLLIFVAKAIILTGKKKPIQENQKTESRKRKGNGIV